MVQTASCSAILQDSTSQSRRDTYRLGLHNDDSTPQPSSDAYKLSFQSAAYRVLLPSVIMSACMTSFSACVCKAMFCLCLHQVKCSPSTHSCKQLWPKAPLTRNQAAPMKHNSLCWQYRCSARRAEMLREYETGSETLVRTDMKARLKREPVIHPAVCVTRPRPSHTHTS